MQYLPIKIFTFLTNSHIQNIQGCEFAHLLIRSFRSNQMSDFG